MELVDLCFERLISFLHKVGEISNYKVEVKMCHSHPCFYYLDLWKHLDDFLDAIKRLLVTYETDNYSYFYEIFWFYQFFFSLPNVSFLLYSSLLQNINFTQGHLQGKQFSFVWLAKSIQMWKTCLVSFSWHLCFKK